MAGVSAVVAVVLLGYLRQVLQQLRRRLGLQESRMVQVSELVKRMVQQDLTLEMEVFYMQFEICHTKNRKQSLKQHIKTSIFEVKLFWTTLYNASWLL